MKQWDIWTCDFADAGPHPAIIVSHPDRVLIQVAVLVGGGAILRRDAKNDSEAFDKIENKMQVIFEYEFRP